IPDQPRRRANTRADQHARRAAVVGARRPGGASRGPGNPGPAARTDDAASRRGDVADARRRRPARRSALARRRSAADARRTGDDRHPGKRQAARHARNPTGFGQGCRRGGRAGVAAGAALARRPAAAQGHRRPEPHRQYRRVTGTVRRRVLLTLALGPPLALSGCGWAPLYGEATSGPASEELRAIHVDPISERIGQRLAIALRNSLNPTGEPTPERYRLQTTLSTSLTNLGIQSEGLASLGKLDVYATYNLIDSKSRKPSLVHTGHVANTC